MANRNTSGYGLIAVGTIGSTPATQGQGKYYIEAADSDDLFQGCTVRMKDGYIVEASSTRTFVIGWLYQFAHVGFNNFEADVGELV